MPFVILGINRRLAKKILTKHPLILLEIVASDLSKGSGFVQNPEMTSIRMSSKGEKEAFVSNLEGTSPIEIILIASSVPIGLFIFLSLCRVNRKSAVNEFAAFWIPAILCQSVWSFPWAVLYFGVLLTAGLFLSATKHIQDETLQGYEESHLTQFCLTIYRACLLCLTCVAILAVDFNFYPRRLAKTEVQGYGWMDLGAASFVIAAGMVTRKAKWGYVKGSSNTKHLRRILPVLFMGMLRLVTHKGIEYQEHASEYGVHWNFFFTLAMLTPLSLLSPHPILVIIIMATYQFLLTVYGLQSWVETAPRTCGASNGFLCGVFYANREGILGCIGYGSLFFASEWIAFAGVWSKKVNLWAIVAALVLGWLILVTIGFPVSRRTTNLPFCVWALLVNFLQLALIQTIAAMKGPPVVPKILDAMNRNGLLAFVIANLLTGLVNLSMDTISTHHATAACILCVYMVAVGLAAVAIQWITKSIQRQQTTSTKKNG